MNLCVIAEGNGIKYVVFEVSQTEYEDMIEQYQQDEYRAYIQNQDNKIMKEYTENKAPNE